MEAHTDEDAVAQRLLAAAAAEPPAGVGGYLVENEGGVDNAMGARTVFFREYEYMQDWQVALIIVGVVAIGLGIAVAQPTKAEIARSSSWAVGQRA